MKNLKSTGMPYISVEGFVRKDTHMQGVFMRDILKILGDKIHHFKNYLFDRAKMKNVKKKRYF